MAPHFKISFPLPRRSTISPNPTTGSQFSNKSNVDDSPFAHPSSKAERTLGASQAKPSESKRKSTWKERTQMRKYPSYMSFTLSKVDGEPVKTPDEFPFPGMPTSAEPLPHLIRNLNSKGSSPVLGEQYSNGTTTIDLDYFSGLPIPQARRAGSAGTLRSHYDSTKSPLAISQQTSASSARDRALRKGCPEISSPLAHNSVQTVRSKDSDRPHSRNPSGDSKLSGSSFKKINGIPRRRPSVTDPPTLYPNAGRAFHAVSPPPALINSTLPRPLQTPQTPSLSVGKWWQRKASSKTPPASPGGDRQAQQQRFEDSFASVKVNVRKPRPGVAGARNWFDSLDVEEEPMVAELQYPEPPSYQLPQKPDAPMNISEIMSLEPHPPASQVTSRKSSFSNKSQHTNPSTRKLSFRLDPVPARPAHTAPMSPPNGGESISRSLSEDSIQSTINGRVMLSKMNLHLESFLELSSSEDEGGESSAASELLLPVRGHKIRPSIDRTSYNSEVLIGNAQCAQPASPRAVVNRLSNRSSGKSNNLETVPPIPSIPAKPKIGQRSSSTRWREMMEDKTTSTESTADSRDSSVSGETKAQRVPPMRVKRKGSIRGSKLMKVTQEEEKLLEAMREKRASIRQDDFEKGFKTAMQLHDAVSRPKTAGADGRTSRSSISGYGSRSSTSPPPQEYKINKSLSGSRLSASTDDLFTEDTYPFPQAPLTLKDPMGFASPAKTSPSLSFSPSDILPSTPTSRNEPITPPAGPIIGCNGMFPARSIKIMNNLGHERKRTVSSSVVMLDGVEQHAQELDEENAITGWAIDRW
ncbi:hypothetical protein N7G274_006428 [Stereocaulon virgatum]|uniref:Proteophosphoglycan ppg4 n=1 Tax=Stereocaulon virgatum TaxID=373712 RepID=A0ABR4A564_9LECA